MRNVWSMIIYVALWWAYDVWQITYVALWWMFDIWWITYVTLWWAYDVWWVTYDVPMINAWCVVYDVWRMILTYDYSMMYVWYGTSNVWCSTYDEQQLMHDLTKHRIESLHAYLKLCTHLRDECWKLIAHEIRLWYTERQRVMLHADCTKQCIHAEYEWNVSEILECST